MGFFQLYKPKEYGYRYIYYDPKREAHKEREKQDEKVHGYSNETKSQSSFQRGTLKELAKKSNLQRQARIRQWNLIILLIIVSFVFLAALFFL